MQGESRTQGRGFGKVETPARPKPASPEGARTKPRVEVVTAKNATGAQQLEGYTISALLFLFALIILEGLFLALSVQPVASMTALQNTTIK